MLSGCEGRTGPAPRAGTWGSHGVLGQRECCARLRHCTDPHPTELPDMIHVLAIITAKPGMREAILKEFHANIPAVHAEEHTSELQSRFEIECRLLLEKKKKKK